VPATVGVEDVTLDVGQWQAWNVSNGAGAAQQDDDSPFSFFFFGGGGGLCGAHPRPCTLRVPLGCAPCGRRP
jgi:hypothetical protein